MVGVEGELGLVALLLAEAEEALHRAVAVGAVDPLARGTPLELRSLGCRRECFACAEKCLDVDAVVDRGCSLGHWCSFAPCWSRVPPGKESLRDGIRYARVLGGEQGRQV